MRHFQWFKDGGRGLILNEALHWLDDGGCNDAGIVTLDSAVEEFRTMLLPNVMSDEIRRIYVCLWRMPLCVSLSHGCCIRRKTALD